MSATQYDLIVAGGGLVGAALGALLVRHGRVDPGRVLLLERDWPQAPQSGAPLDLRVSAFSRASQRILTAAGAWAHLDLSRVAPYRRMRVWHEGIAPENPAALDLDAAEVAEPDLGAIIENRAVQAAALAAYVEGGGQVWREPLTRLVAEEDCVRVSAGEHSAQARLVIGADGAHSRVRELSGISITQRSYGQQAIVAMIRPALPHASTAYQVFLPTGPLALLPLSDGHCSIVWSLREEQVQRCMALPADAFSRELTRASSGVLGPLELVGTRAAFALRRVSADRYVSGRVVLVGDAAHVIHPLAGQGVNQGLLDAAALCQAIGARPAQEDVAARGHLRAYERRRRSGNAVMGAAMDSFDALFTQSHALGIGLTREAMGVVARSGAARRFMMRQALGLDVQLPQAGGAG